MVSRRLWTLVAALLIGVLASTSNAAAATPDYGQAKRLTKRVAKNAANIYGGDRPKFTGCTRTNPRRLICTYEFRRGIPELDLTWCFGDVIFQAGKRGVRYRADFPECY